MQTAEGVAPNGFVEVEFQEWLRLRAIPAIRDACKEHFKEHGHPCWFSWKVYQDLCAAVGHVHSGADPLFLLSLDSDPRHGMAYKWLKIDHRKRTGNTYKRKLPDRRDIPKGEPGHIPLDKHKNYVPSAPKVPDAHQFPIESLFAAIKKKYHSILGENKHPEPDEMWAAIEQAFREVAGQSTVQHCFEHGDDNMRLFAADHETEMHLGQWRCLGTNGKWLPKPRRG